MQRIVTLFLLILMATTLTGFQTVSVSSPFPVHPAGCHNERPVPVPPGPTDHQCCLNAHQAAIATTAPSRHLMAGWTSAIAESGEAGALAAFAVAVASCSISANSPPGVTALRI